MKEALIPTSLNAFLPAKDYETSVSFYEALGFDLMWKVDALCEFHAGRFSFFVQNAYRKEWAENMMLSMVCNVDNWWAHLEELDLERRFPGVKRRDPTVYPWDMREVHLIDPAGVCWHFAEPVKRNSQEEES